MAVRIQMRRDTGANWTLNDPILAEGEMGVELDTYRWKLGDGINHWNALPYSNQIFSGQSLISDNSDNPALTIRQQGSGAALLIEDQSAVDPTPFIVTGNGSVGIGTSTPSAPFDVEGNAIIVDNSDNAALKVTQTGSGPAFYVEDASGDISPFVIDATGSVGVGTTTPSASLDVQGTGRFTGQLSANSGAIIKNIDIGITNPNTIDTSSGNLVIDSAGGQTTINDNVVVGGILQTNSALNLNNQDISNIDSASFNLSSTEIDAVGKLVWNNVDGTLNLGLKGGNTTIQIGQESVAYCHNAESTTLIDGTVVYVYGSSDGRISVKKANASAENTSVAFGVVTEHIAAGESGFVTVFGLVHGLNTQGYGAGSPIYVDTVSGQFTAIKPTQPNHIVVVGFIAVEDTVNGSIFVDISNGLELEELHNVLLSSVTNRDILSYDSASTLWKNKPIIDAIKDVDGPGSGIDADLLDGQHGSYYAPITSPSFITSVTTNETTFSAFNTNATTINFAGAATSLNIGGTPTTSILANFMTNATSSGALKVINIGTAGTSGSTTNINIGSSVSGADTNIAMNGLVTAATAAVDTNTNQLATTAFVIGQEYLKSSTASSTYAPLASPALTGNASVTSNSSSAALRVTQTGGGLALLVEDEANPDSTPFVVDATGNVGVGLLSPSYKLDVSGIINATSFYVNGAPLDLLPSQATHAGQFLTTDGSVTSWATVDALPAQSGQAGKFLTTDGTTATWATVEQGGGGGITTDVVLTNSWWLGV